MTTFIDYRFNGRHKSWVRFQKGLFDDSQNLVPKLAKTLEAARFPMKQFVMYGVDRAKQTGGIESKLYDVKRVPTIVVYKGNVEAGRIVESVKRNVETDLAQIIHKDAGQQ